MASEQAPITAPLALSKYSKRVLLQTIFSRPDGVTGLIGQRVVVGGWVKASREFKKEVVPPPSHIGGPKDVSCAEVLQTKLPFFRSIIKIFGGDHPISDKQDSIFPRPPQPSISILQITDGSCTSSLRVLIDSSLASPGHVMPTGTCILAEGVLQKPFLQDKEIIEVKAEKVLHIGLVDQDRYPLSKKHIPLESLRDSAHFRPRTTTVASVMRISNCLTQATITFFQESGFVYVQLPVITSTDCEGRGQLFQVTTSAGKERDEHRTIGDELKLETVKASIKEKRKQVEEIKRSQNNKEALAVAMQDFKKTFELASQLEAKQKGKSKGGDEVFCGQTAYLTPSGRMHLESCASGLGNVYSFGPRFHANKSEPKKLLAEMWMVELEMAFSELEDSMECAIDYLKFMCKWILDNCTEDLNIVSKHVDKLVVDCLQLIATSPFKKISYTDAVEVLNQGNFDRKIEWGVPLSEEHESYLTDEIYKKPIIIYNYPKQLKPFNARINDDIRTCAAFDVIVPKVGTLVRGSQSEERANILSARINELGLEKQQYEWYLDLYKHGGAKCSGFSILLDPLVLYATGLNDVRDAVPFPRSYGEINN